MKHFWCEYICDTCDNGMHINTDKAKKGYHSMSTNQQIRRYGWIITADGHHFCTKECYKTYKEQQND